MRIIDTLFASNRTFAIKRSINCSETEDLREIADSLRVARDLYVLHKLDGIKKKEVVPRFKDFKRPPKTLKENKTHDAASLLYAIKETESDKTFKELIGPPDTMKAKQFHTSKAMESTERPRKLIRHPNIRRAMKSPDIRRALKTLLEASSLLNIL